MSNAVDDDLARAAAEAEGEFEDGVDDAIEEAAAPAGAAPAARQPRRRRGRRLRAVSGGAGAPAPAAVTATRPPPSPDRVQNKNVALIWQQIVEEKMRAVGREPSDAWIRVKRFAMGPRTVASASEDLGNIDGAAVAGTDQQSAGEDLVNYVTDVFHLTGTGAARYTFQWYWKSGANSTIAAPEGELVLGDPKEIVRRREAALQVARRKQYEGLGSGVGYAPPSLAYGRPPVYQQPPQQPTLGPPPPAPAPLPNIPGASAELQAIQQSLEQQRRDTARLNGIYEERLRQEGLRPVAAPPQADASEQMARGIAMAFQALGFTPDVIQRLHAPPPPPPPAAPPQPPPPPPGPPPTAAQVKETVGTSVGALDQLFVEMERADRLKSRLRRYLGVDEDEGGGREPETVEPTKIEVQDDPWKMKEIPFAGQVLGLGSLQHGPRMEGESTIDYITRLAMHNPVAATKIAEKVMTSMSSGAVGQLLQKVLENTATGRAMGGNVVDMPAPPPPTVGQGAPPPPPPPSPPKGWNPSG